MIRLRQAALALLFTFAAVTCDEVPVVPPPGGGNDTIPDGVEIFLNIKTKVTFGGEQGLLGLAFDPDYVNNRFFYVNYTAGVKTIISRWQTSAIDPNRADPNSEYVLMEFDQPEPAHNGGALAFDNDGYLLVALGDGGGAGDPRSYGQNRTNIYGTILRIDVHNPSGGNRYGIPPTNPFVGNIDGWREEIYAWGFRNPWRMTIDRQTGWILAGDVGQNTIEEVDLITSGGNYGWDCKEGSQPYVGPPDGPSAVCPVFPVVDPIWEYPHQPGTNNSVTGGYIYRGDSLSTLSGCYVYGDYVSGRIWAFNFDGATATNNRELFDSDFFIPSFGVGEDNNLYLLEYQAGRIHELVETENPPGTFTFSLREPWPTYTFNLPIGLYNAGDGTNRLFVLEQAGRILVLDGSRN